ncbi:metallophosphoesterase family protein [Enhygromyxa salina]|uniref:Calcineurin-like phosphoesterase n=1 Tax=Enhygromyxa salina TaxID=215803 RepID=A0A2S9XPY1_9BACT|nr:metallophosphoesterase family protein [Enhygromyxa salina]PRP94751.1 Calcineurin-like phosphoesterase [Enhygromyxa salina]
MAGRVRILPARGQLLISTDLHGNHEDFRRLRAVFDRLCEAAEHPDLVHWASLGDLVHGPSPVARQRDALRFGYPDESAALVEAMIELRARFPANFHLLLGNHDHGHIGGPHTSKFYRDEVEMLERRMSADAIARMHALFRGALLAVAAPCGLLLCHGSPDEQIPSLDQLGALEPSGEAELAQRSMLRTLLTSYGQAGETTNKLLRQLSQPGLDLRVVVHGHDVDLDGWYTEHGNQACPVLFGAPPSKRRYLVVDLGARYERAEDLREGFEARHLYPELV